MSTITCPICNESMDFMVISHKNHAFVDGKCYPAICFSCYQVPKTFVYEFDKKGNIISTDGPHYSHQFLHTAEELYEIGSADSLKQAQKSVESVTKACKKISLRAIKKLKMKKPAPIFEFSSIRSKKKSK